MNDEPTSILVFRNGSLGNTLAAVPALRSLRQRYPKIPLTVVVDPIGQQILAHCPWIDRLIVYDKRGHDRGLSRHLKLVRALRSVHPSHAILFKRFFRNGLLARLSGARVRAGFITDGKAPFLNLTISYDESVSVVELNLRLAALLDAPSTNRHLELFLAPKDIDEAEQFVTHANPAGRNVYVAHYGGRTTTPDFLPVERFATLLKEITHQNPVFLIGFGHGETLLAERIRSHLPTAHIACNLPLRVTAAMMQKAALFVGFNSGPAHLAAAVGIPELIFFRPDHHTEKEIRKWLPPSECAMPFVPPTGEDETAWAAFTTNVLRVADELTRAGTTA
jgi:ADP-heptose:LPS heptosyltransferase